MRVWGKKGEMGSTRIWRKEGRGRINESAGKGREMDHLLDKIMSDSVPSRTREVGGEESRQRICLGNASGSILNIKVSPHSSQQHFDIESVDFFFSHRKLPLSMWKYTL